MQGFLAFMAQIGRGLCYKIGAYLFEYGKVWPFVMIGIFNFVFVAVIIVLILFHVLDKRPDEYFEFEENEQISK